jgi:hypothetical protein
MLVNVNVNVNVAGAVALCCHPGGRRRDR